MNRTCQLSNVTKDYLAAYQKILFCMMQEMNGIWMTDSISRNFIGQMIPHHRAAIEMSKNLLRYTTNIPLQDLASRMITEQTRGIADMRRIEPQCGRICNSRQELAGYQRRIGQVTRNMFRSMQQACADNLVNANYIREMIPHHRGAVEMAQAALRYNICPDLKLILCSIISAQEQEILLMQRLLRCMGG